MSFFPVNEYLNRLCECRSAAGGGGKRQAASVQILSDFVYMSGASAACLHTHSPHAVELWTHKMFSQRVLIIEISTVTSRAGGGRVSEQIIIYALVLHSITTITVLTSNDNNEHINIR